jgi:L-ribulokinase
MLIAGSPQTPALGAALAAGVTAGAEAGGYADWFTAQDRMTTIKEKTFVPNADAHRVYTQIYGLYRELHDTFGGVSGARPSDLGTAMKRLLAIKERA